MLIFNFHHVEAKFRHPERKNISITPEGLRQFIRTIRLAGMNIVSLKSALETVDPTRNSKRCVVITFDDGYLNNLEEALPVLEEERCPATVFVLPGRFGGTNEWDQAQLYEAERDQLLSLEQMKQLAASPYITLGSHGMLHRRFPELSEDGLRYEMLESHRILSEEFPDDYLPVLAYPWGDHDDRVVAMMTDTPYRYAFTVETRPWESTDHRFRVPRYSAFDRDGNPVILLAKLLRHKLLFA
jgi:peptidoglycan/xylan/chitin deacetylase (PgdA/CDA1 family)